MSEPTPLPVRLHVPPDLVAGTYANFAAVWHSPHEFTLDFGVSDMETTDPDGAPFLPVNVVARIKVPPSLIFEIARTIADNLDRYEQRFGPIRPPSPTGPSGPTGADDPGDQG